MANYEVWSTPVGERQLRELTGPIRENARRAMDNLERSGCRAAHYRLEGDEVERFCVLDLGRDWSMIVAFPEAKEVAVILVGRHIDKRPAIDVYRQLYRSIGIDFPTIEERLGHPPCCPDGKPPVDRELVDDFIARAEQLRRERARRRR